MFEKYLLCKIKPEFETELTVKTLKEESPTNSYKTDIPIKSDSDQITSENDIHQKHFYISNSKCIYCNDVTQKQLINDKSFVKTKCIELFDEGKLPEDVFKYFHRKVRLKLLRIWFNKYQNGIPLHKVATSVRRYSQKEKIEAIEMLRENEAYEVCKMLKYKIPYETLRIWKLDIKRGEYPLGIVGPRLSKEVRLEIWNLLKSGADINEVWEKYPLLKRETLRKYCKKIANGLIFRIITTRCMIMI